MSSVIVAKKRHMPNFCFHVCVHVEYKKLLIGKIYRVAWEKKWKAWCQNRVRNAVPKRGPPQLCVNKVCVKNVNSKNGLESETTLLSFFSNFNDMKTLQKAPVLSIRQQQTYKKIDK